MLERSSEFNWKIKVVDRDLDLVKQKIAGHENGEAAVFNAIDSEQRKPEIEKSDLVISMLPARFHYEVALDCIELKTDLITPSYISEEMRSLDQKAKGALEQTH